MPLVPAFQSLRQEDHIHPGIWDQLGLPRETPEKQKQITYNKSLRMQDQKQNQPNKQELETTRR